MAVTLTPGLPCAATILAYQPRKSLLWTHHMIRTALLSAVAAAFLTLTAAPAFAGPAETAFLQKLTASWTGKGKLIGAQTGPISCRIVVTGGNPSVKYQ